MSDLIDLPAQFTRLEWRDDRMLLDELVFRLEHNKTEDLELGDCFRFFKIKKLMDQYQAFWSLRPAFRARNIFELGIWDGGSMVLWFEMFQPDKLVAVDVQYWEDSTYLKKYRDTRGLEGRLKTYWMTFQEDKAAIRQIAAGEFPEPLDLVLDDASHMYAPTRASFEVLFPLLRPGGLYFIEDWAWAHWQGYQGPDHEWALIPPLTRLVRELIEVTGTSTRLISSVTAYEGFAVIERGPAEAKEFGEFDLDQHILRRPDYTRWSIFQTKLRRKIGKLFGKPS